MFFISWPDIFRSWPDVFYILSRYFYVLARCFFYILARYFYDAFISPVTDFTGGVTNMVEINSFLWTVLGNWLSVQTTFTTTEIIQSQPSSQIDPEVIVCQLD